MVECWQSMYFFYDKWHYRSLWRVVFETYQGALVTQRKTLDLSLWISFVLIVLYSPITVYHMSIWDLLCTYILEVCFLWIKWIYGPKPRIFLVVLSLTSDALFWRVSAMSVFDRGKSPSILLRFEPKKMCFYNAWITRKLTFRSMKYEKSQKWKYLENAYTQNILRQHLHPSFMDSCNELFGCSYMTCNDITALSLTKIKIATIKLIGLHTHIYGLHYTIIFFLFIYLKFYLTWTECSFPRGEATGDWSWQLTSICNLSIALRITSSLWFNARKMLLGTVYSV
jgi:hypothetical protein